MGSDRSNDANSGINEQMLHQDGAIMLSSSGAALTVSVYAPTGIQSRVCLIPLRVVSGKRGQILV